MALIKILKCTGLRTEPWGALLIISFQLEHGAIDHNSLAASVQPVPYPCPQLGRDSVRNIYFSAAFGWDHQIKFVLLFLYLFFSSTGRLLTRIANWVGHLNISSRNVCSNLAHWSCPTWRCSRWLSTRTSVITAQVNTVAVLSLQWICTKHNLYSRVFSVMFRVHRQIVFARGTLLLLHSRAL